MVVIGTRGSRLALWQAEYFKAKLESIGIESRLEIIKTQGDRVQHLSFDKLEGKGFFTKEIEDALLAGTIDLAIHSLKDMPTSQPEGLTLAALSYRADPADLLLIHPKAYDDEQPLKIAAGARVGTSSARRKAQLLDLQAGLVLEDIRGNVPTRLQKVRDGEVDAVLLAAAGLERLELDYSDLHCVRLHPREFVPAAGQGVMAVQTRLDDTNLRRQLAPLHQTVVGNCTNVERKTLQLLGGGCQSPLGVHCFADAAGNYHAYAALAESWDGPLRRAQHSSSTHAGLAQQLVAKLKA